MPKIKVSAYGSKNGFHILECHKKDDTGKKMGYKFINAQLFKDMGIIKRFPGFTAVQKYLNTEEGLKFYEEAIHMPIF